MLKNDLILMQKYVLHKDIKTTVNRLIRLGPLARLDPSFRTYTVKSVRWNSKFSGNLEFYPVRFLLYYFARMVGIPTRFAVNAAPARSAASLPPLPLHHSVISLVKPLMGL